MRRLAWLNGNRAKLPPRSSSALTLPCTQTRSFRKKRTPSPDSATNGLSAGRRVADEGRIVGMQGRQFPLGNKPVPGRNRLRFRQSSGSFKLHGYDLLWFYI